MLFCVSWLEFIRMNFSMQLVSFALLCFHLLHARKKNQKKGTLTKRYAYPLLYTPKY